MYLLGVAVGGFPWMSVDTLQKEIPFWVKNLITQWTSMTFLGRQWSGAGDGNIIVFPTR